MITAIIRKIYLVNPNYCSAFEKFKAYLYFD